MHYYPVLALALAPALAGRVLTSHHIEDHQQEAKQDEGKREPALQQGRGAGFALRGVVGMGRSVCGAGSGRVAVGVAAAHGSICNRHKSGSWVSR